ncbi:MAG: ABC transporter permease [Candidatus Bipolaricaulota bacterium]
MRGFVSFFRSLRQYPSAIAGLIIVGILVGISVYAVIAIPYGEAIRLWRGGAGVWDDYPRNAAPIWYDLFTPARLSRTIVLDSRTTGERTAESLGDGTERVRIALGFDFPYDSFPTELTLYTDATYEGKRTRYSVLWTRPDGSETPIVTDRGVRTRDGYYLSQDIQLLNQMPGRTKPEIGLFLDPAQFVPGAGDPKPVKGRYTLTVEAVVPEGFEFESKLVAYGQVHGLAGTDDRRRDLTVALLWGAPLALIFGLLGAVGANVTTFVLAGIGTWYGGRLDAIFQRLTQLNMLLPTLPILIMIGQFYSRSLWLMLAIIILLSIFSAGMLTYRAMFLQAKQAPYIEAAKAYGASNFRLIFRYLLPRIVPVLLPQFVLVIPGFVFLETSLAVLGLGDPLLPTWGKVINDARGADALYKGYYYWVIQPAIALMFTGFGFAMIGYALDRIFNPRLRTM